jgi:hypothetical protein
MTKHCASCRQVNRDAAIYCRSCATRFSDGPRNGWPPGSDHRTLDARVVDLRGSSKQLGETWRRYLSGAAEVDWARLVPEADPATWLLSAVVAVCAFLLWYMGAQ